MASGPEGELIANAAVTWFLTGLSWTVQLVHYPMFGHFERSRFAAIHAEHSRRISWIVGPAMAAELGLAAHLALSAARTTSAIAGACLVILIWAVTAIAIIPVHERLAREGAQPRLVTTLVRLHWVRTIAWTARALLAAVRLSG